MKTTEPQMMKRSRSDRDRDRESRTRTRSAIAIANANAIAIPIANANAIAIPIANANAIAIPIANANAIGDRDPDRERERDPDRESDPRTSSSSPAASASAVLSSSSSTIAPKDAVTESLLLPWLLERLLKEKALVERHNAWLNDELTAKVASVIELRRKNVLNSSFSGHILTDPKSVDTDMDAKVKAMIKLIEEDADSIARRAEMYYKKRPELMKLVKEFYRAYRALAERYDHAELVSELGDDLTQAAELVSELWNAKVKAEYFVYKRVMKHIDRAF
ncbi:hypothetical protein SO802_032457 [Lithocarpus litseifolius]|uniref:NAB domain-containing protein n=1 Tax=Lithocarpus litseifolius TaxID=425828 RepID=A0AAW2BAT1_9ROSI